MPLVLKNCRAPGVDSEPKVFGNWRIACDHVCDHLLSAPESEGWALLMPGFEEILSTNAGFRLAKRSYSSEGEPMQDLYDAYAARIDEALASAAKTGWHWPDNTGEDERKAFGISGVLVVYSPARVLTAMLPGMGHPGSVEESKEVFKLEDRKKDPTPRNSKKKEGQGYGMRRFGRKRIDRSKYRSFPDIEEPEEVKRFRLFRACAQFVRSEWVSSLWFKEDWEGEPHDLRSAIADFSTWSALAAGMSGKPGSQDAG